jgi:hypothetical protein
MCLFYTIGSSSGTATPDRLTKIAIRQTKVQRREKRKQNKGKTKTATTTTAKPVIHRNKTEPDL